MIPPRPGWGRTRVRRLAVLVFLAAAGLLVLLAGGAGPGWGPASPDRPAAHAGTRGGGAGAAGTGDPPRARPMPQPTLTRAPPSTAAPGGPQPEVAPAAAPLPRAAPTRLRIPAIGVDSSLMDLGLNDDGTLQTPPGPFPAGWYTGGPTPGQTGPAIIVGHVRYVTPGVFADLSDLRPGDEITVERSTGREATFRVRHLARFDKDAFPTQRVYGDLDHPGLRLITCDGLDTRTGTFEDNVVVFADLVRP